MKFDIRMLLVCIAFIPCGILITLIGFEESGGVPVFPAGKFAGPVVILLGIVLIVMTVRSLGRGE